MEGAISRIIQRNQTVPKVELDRRSRMTTIADELIRMTRRELFLLGAAMAVPRLVSAQQVGSWLVGVLDPAPGPDQSTLSALREGLEDAGLDRGLVPVEYRWTAWTDNRFNPLLTLAIDLVMRDVGVIVTGFRGIQAAKAATSSIPIVFFGGKDIIEAGLVESADRPGGNLTGIVVPSEGDLRQLGLLAELVPQGRVIAVLVNPNNEAGETEIQELREATRGMGMQLEILKAGIEGDFETSFADLASCGVNGLLVSADPFFDTWRQQLVSLTARYAIPTIYGWREFTDVGGLISYGPSRTRIWRQAGLYAGKILKGAKPVDLPAVSPHAPALASELLSNFPEVMLHPASLPRRSVRYALADLVFFMPKPPTMLTTFVLLAPAWSTLRAPLPVWPTLYRDHVRRGDRSKTERGCLCRCRQRYADGECRNQCAHFCLTEETCAALLANVG